MLSDLFFLILIIFIGCVGIYQDLKKNKIKNKWIIIGIFLGFFIHIVTLYFSEGKIYRISIIYKNFFLSVIISYLIWYFKLWAAGDAKLFILFSFLIPLKYYGNKQLISFFPSFTLLVNIFILVMVYLILEICFKIIKSTIFYLKNSNRRQDFIKRWLNLKEKINQNKIKFLKIIWGYLCIFLLIRISLIHFGQIILFFSPLTKFAYLILILAYKPLSMAFSKIKKTLWLPTILLFGYILINLYIKNLTIFLELIQTFKHFFSFMGILFIFRVILRLYLEKKETIKINVQELRPKMLLTEKSMKSFKSDIVGKFYPDGLSKEQVEIIKRDYPEKEIEIYRTFPLAPFIFLGSLITILIKTSLLKIIPF